MFQVDVSYIADSSTSRTRRSVARSSACFPVSSATKPFVAIVKLFSTEVPASRARLRWVERRCAV